MQFISITRRPRLWVVLGLATVIGQGCDGLSTQPVVTPMVAEKENLPTAPEAKGRSFLTKTFVWTIPSSAALSGETEFAHDVQRFLVLAGSNIQHEGGFSQP